MNNIFDPDIYKKTKIETNLAQLRCSEIGFYSDSYRCFNKKTLRRLETSVRLDKRYCYYGLLKQINRTETGQQREIDQLLDFHIFIGNVKSLVVTWSPADCHHSFEI